jgi:hypothetical protein
MRVREPVQTDQEGHFLIPKLYAYNDYILRIEVAGYERKWTDWIHVCYGQPGLNRVRPGESESVEIRLREAPAFAAGRVVDAKGNLAPKTRVLLGHLCLPDTSTETDAKGNFRIDSLFPDQEVELWFQGTTVKAKAGKQICTS